jgi:hypothetical protein
LIRNKMTCHFKTLKPHLSCCFLRCFFLLLQYQILLMIFCIASHIWQLQRMKFWRRTVWCICLRCLKHFQVKIDLHFGSDGSIHVSISSFDSPLTFLFSSSANIFYGYCSVCFWRLSHRHIERKAEGSIWYDFCKLIETIFFNFWPVEKLWIYLVRNYFLFK